MKRRTFCRTLAAALAAGTLSPHAVAQAALPEAEQAVVGRAVPEDYYPVAFRSDLSMRDCVHEFYYSDALFSHSALEYDHALALATLGMTSAAACSYASEARYWVDGEAGREANIAAALEALGFANPRFLNYDHSLNTPATTAGCVLSQKTLVRDGAPETLLAVFLSGGGYGAEWVSNVVAGETGGHAGFLSAADPLFAQIKAYLDEAAQAHALGTIRVWMGGYSRGGIVANMLAAKLCRELPQLAPERMFVYNFAVPAALTAADRPDLQQAFDNNHAADGTLKTDWDACNIFNLISSADLVPRVLPEVWDFHRNGNDRFLPATVRADERAALDVLGRSFGPEPLEFESLATAEDTDALLQAVLKVCPTRQVYAEKYEPVFRDILQAAFTRSQEEVEDGKVLSDREITARLCAMDGMKQFHRWKVYGTVKTASTMSRPILAQLGDVVPLQAQQIIIPVLAVGLCYGIETDVIKLLAYYLVSLITVRGPLDNVLRAAFCHFPENYIALMEYYDPSEHGMQAYTRR